MTHSPFPFVLTTEKVLERGEHIELLVDKTETLNQQAFHFKKKANTLKKQQWWRNQKTMLLLVMVILVCVGGWVWVGVGVHVRARVCVCVCASVSVCVRACASMMRCSMCPWDGISVLGFCFECGCPSWACDMGCARAI